MKYRYRVRYKENGEWKLTGLMNRGGAEQIAEYLRGKFGEAEIIDEEAGVVK